MRKSLPFICLVFCILISVFGAFSVCAQSTTYYIEELGMYMDIPDNMDVRTKKNTTKLSAEIYLEAVSSNADNGLAVRVWMQKNEKTQEFFNLSLLSQSALEAYRNNLLSNPEYSDCTTGEYGGVLFLDFSATDTVGETVVYGRESQTIVNGMCIGIMSTSDSDPLTSAELDIIKNMLESIRFEEILSNKAGIGFWQIFIPILIVIVILVAGFFVLSYFMGKKSREEKMRRKKARERKGDYDVLSRAENSPRQNRVSGYKSSSDFFDDAFEGKSSPATSQSRTEAVRRKSSETLKSSGNFFKNLKRELSKSKNKKGKKQRKPVPKKRINEDFDIFNDKI